MIKLLNFLGFNAGDTIFVTDTSNEVWWFGWKRLNGKFTHSMTFFLFFKLIVTFFILFYFLETSDEFIGGIFPSKFVVDQTNPEEIPSSVS